MFLKDASFANVVGLKSQLSYFLLIVDDSGRYNIVHYSSNKFRRISSSVMTAEFQALVLVF